MKIEMTRQSSCRLSASGFTHTLDGVYDWAKVVVAAAKKKLNGPITLTLWAYRHGGHEYLAADFYTKANESYCLSFVVHHPHDFDLEQPGVPDMTEALHMVGIVAEALEATIEIGCRQNETNKYCTPAPWQPGQTNARLVLI